jgi:hypothetical protein
MSHATNFLKSVTPSLVIVYLATIANVVLAALVAVTAQGLKRKTTCHNQHL